MAQNKKFSRRFFLSGVSSLTLAGILSEAGRVFSRQTPAGRLLLGLVAPTYYNGFNPFLNWWKTGAPPSLRLTSGQTLNGAELWNNGPYLSTETGDLNKLAPDVHSISRIFFAPTNKFQVALGTDYSGERWVAEWDGGGQANIDFLTKGGIQTKGKNRIDFIFGSKPGNTAITFVIDDLSNPPRNIRIYQSRYSLQMARGETFNPDWVRAIEPFGILRFMGWMPTNDENISEFRQLASKEYYSWCKPLNEKSEFGPKGSIHPSIISEIANLVGCKLHVCIPVKASDEFVASFATFFRDSVRTEVTYEFSNECWNFQFSQTRYCLDQGTKLWPNDGARFAKWYGYRSAQIMKIIRDVYGDKMRWRGAIATQTVNPGITRAILEGIEFWRANFLSPANSLSVSDLFGSLYVTGYFGDVLNCKGIGNITKSNPAVVTSNDHGYKNGSRIKLFLRSGMTELNGKIVTVANSNKNSYELEGIDTSNFSNFINGNNYAIPSAIFELIEKSIERSANKPAEFSNQYSFFNQTISQSLMSGFSQGFSTMVNVEALRSRYWPAQLAIAKEAGLTLRQYEGGNHFVGDAYLNGYGGNEKFTEHLIALGNSPELAPVYTASYEAFLALGGEFPAKFVESGTTSQFGTWAGFRFLPLEGNGNKSDEDNPVWRSVLLANSGFR